MGKMMSDVLGTQKVNIPDAPTPPAPEKPAEMPDPGNTVTMQKKRQAYASQLRSGRASTILSDSADKLG